MSAPPNGDERRREPVVAWPSGPTVPVRAEEPVPSPTATGRPPVELPSIAAKKPRERFHWKPSDLPRDIVDDAGNFLKEIFYEIPVGLYGLAKFYITNPGEYVKDLKTLIKPANTWEVIKHAGDMMIEDYRTGKIVHKPIHAAVDVTLVVSGIGKAVQLAGRAARAARIAELAKVARATGKTVDALAGVDEVLPKAERLVRLGMSIEEAPGRYARRLIDRAVERVSGGKWSLPKRREVLRLYSEETARAEQFVATAERRMRAYVDPLNEAQKIKVDRALVFGLSRRGLETLRADPAAWRAYHYLARMGQYMRGFWRKERMLSDYTIRAATLRRAMVEVMTLKPQWTPSEALKVAKRLIRRAVVKPVYRPNIFVTRGRKFVALEDPLTEMIRGGVVQRRGKVGQLEALKGAMGYSHDPGLYFREAIRSFARAEGDLRFEKRVLANVGLTKVPPGVVSQKFEPVAASPFLKYEARYLSRASDDARRTALKNITDPTVQRLLKWFWIRREPSILGRLYDRINKLIARQGTVYSPSWAVGQYIGNIALAALAGWSPVGPRLRKLGQMPAEVMTKGGLAPRVGAGANFIQAIGDTSAAVGQFADAMARSGIVHHRVARNLRRAAQAGEMANISVEESLGAIKQLSNLEVQIQRAREAIASRSGSLRSLDSEIVKLEKEYNAARIEIAGKSPAEAQAVKDLGDHISDLQKLREDMISDVLANHIREGQLESMIPGIKRVSEKASEAIRYANSFIGEYLALDGFEQNVLRRAFIFYPWVKTMTMLGFRIPFLAPTRAFLYDRFAAMLYTMGSDPELPEYVREGYIPLMGHADGKITYFRIARYSPFESLRTAHWGQAVPFPAGFHPIERNPTLTLVLKTFGYRTEFDTIQTPYGEPAVDLTDGSIVRFEPDGKIRKQMYQMPLAQAVISASPFLQWMKAIAMPYWTNRYNEYGWPVPTYDESGKYRYPRELIDRLGAVLGVSLMTRKPEELKRAEKTKIQHFILEAVRKGRAGSPEDKRRLLEVIRRWRAGEYEHISR